MISDREDLYKLSYAAGLIDGEGCIGSYYNKVHKNYQLRLQVEMCDKEGLDELASLFGGKFYFRDSKPPRRAKWTWLTFNSEAELALKQLLPFLKVKKKQALAALKADWASFKGKPLTLEQQNIRKDVSEQLKLYNKRGTN